MSSTPPRGFVVLVPVKPPARAKSRLADLGDEVRRALVQAFAHDTVTAAQGAPGVRAVMVVTDDHLLAAALRGTDVRVLPDGVAGDLNGALVQAAAEANRRWPDAGLAAICADLPALAPADLGSALAEAAGHPSSFVADAVGKGTTLYAARSLEEFTPCFGADSRAEHADQGAHEIVEVDVPTLRRDVDTPADLEWARRLGMGTRTAEAVSRHRL